MRVRHAEYRCKENKRRMDRNHDAVHRLPAAQKVNERRNVVRGELNCSSCHVEAVGWVG